MTGKIEKGKKEISVCGEIEMLKKKTQIEYKLGVTLKEQIRIGPFPLFTVSHMTQRKKRTSAKSDRKEKARKSKVVEQCW